MHQSHVFLCLSSKSDGSELAILVFILQYFCVHDFVAVSTVVRVLFSILVTYQCFIPVVDIAKCLPE